MADYTKVSGGAPTESAVLVNADQVTIKGDGSIQDPLRAVGAVENFIFPDPATGPGGLIPGLAVLVTNSTYAKADNSADTTANARGLYNVVNGVGMFQASGPLTLTTAEWDAVTGQSGGLTPGSFYFLGTGGDITTTAPVASGSFSAIVGYAESATTLNIRLFAANGPHA
jgi:hypothetical protein